MPNAHIASVADTTEIASVSTSYAAARKSTLAVPSKINRASLTLRCTSLSSSPTTITAFISENANGDGTHWLPETTATLSLGVTTTTVATAVIFIDAPIDSGNTTLYVFYKCDTGTLTVEVCTLAYEPSHTSASDLDR